MPATVTRNGRTLNIKNSVLSGDELLVLEAEFLLSPPPLELHIQLADRDGAIAEYLSKKLRGSTWKTKPVKQAIRKGDIY